jgi:hypothetical protein
VRRLAALAALLLCACTTIWDDSQVEANIVAPGNFRAGSGVIQSVGVLPKGGKNNQYRLYLHMDVGGFQSVDIDRPIYMAGDAVELTNDGRVVRVSGTAVQQAVGRGR